MEINYIERLAEDIRAEVNPVDLPDDNTRLLFRIYAVLALGKGAEVDLEDVHNAWVAWMTSIDPRHEALTPYAELSHETREADRPYMDAIHRALAQVDK